MSDTSAFIAGCATTGAAALMLLLARLGMGESPTAVDRVEVPPAQETVVPVPAPPAVPSDTLAQEKLLDELQEQQAQSERLQVQLSQQDLMIRDLESRLQQQQQETQALSMRLSGYESSVSNLTTQQQQFAGIQRDTDKAQSSLLWVGAGLVMVVLIGGAVVLIILVVLVAFQSRGRSTASSSPVVYSTEVPVSPNIYYRQDFLPPPKQPRRVYPQDVYD